MKTLIAVDETGRMVLPKVMRDSLRLHGNGKIMATVIDDHVELAPLTETPVATKKAGRFIVIKATGEAFGAVGALDASRNE